MRFLIIDGNSILNRAFYGIKLLATKNGRFVNGIYGFLNILIKLREQCSPDAAAIAFDLKAPTFRHALYKEYKAGRKGMPEELASQLPVLKELLPALGYKTVELESFEADDILGTLSCCCKPEDSCIIATGDRDALQLVRDNISVMLASTKMGRPQTVLYDTARVLEEYKVQPEQLIDIKALMGDSSDNIPGVPGVGQKTASDLIAKFHSIDKLYENIDSSEIKDNLRLKLISGKDSAYISRTLGTINKQAPISCVLDDYVIHPPSDKAHALLADLEMFSIIEKLSLKPSGEYPPEKTEERESVKIIAPADTAQLLEVLRQKGKAFFVFESDGKRLQKVAFNIDGKGGTELHALSDKNPAFKEFIKEFLSDSAILKYTFDLKTLYSCTKRLGTELACAVFDALLSGYVLNPQSKEYSPGRLAQEYGVSCPLKSDDELLTAAAVLPHLHAVMSSKTDENLQAELLSDIELPLSEVLSDMEILGFEVDTQGISDFGRQIEIKAEEITGRIYEQVGYELNLNSPKQLGEALFSEDKLGLPHGKKTKSGYSTNAEILEKLADEYPVVRDILEYRTLAKLKSTYCDGLLRLVAADGRIHSTFNQTETRTGRISSTEPNLQNIPVRQALGRELRKFFKAKDGCVLVDADYSQIELRVLADIAADKTMINAFNENLDIHAITASQVFGLPQEMVTPLMRSRAKAVNFGIVYGIGAFSLSKDIGVSIAEADRYIKGYLSHYSGVREYMASVVQEAKSDGFVSTLFGRRRLIPELSSSNKMLRAFGERVALNAPIQGTAADIIKLAMVRVYKRLRDENMQSRLILQVHDELIVEAPENEAEKAAVIVREEMENAAKLKVRLRADVNTGKTWYEAKGT